MDKVLADTKNLKDASYTVHYDMKVKLGEIIPKALTVTSEKHSGSDTLECDFMSGVTYYKLGAQTGAVSTGSAMPLAEEGMKKQIIMIGTANFSGSSLFGRLW